MDGQERSTEFPVDEASSLSWSPDGRALIMTVDSNVCDPANWKRSLVRIETASLASKTLVAADPRLLAITRWAAPERAELTDRDGKLWWLDTTTGAVTAR